MDELRQLERDMQLSSLAIEKSTKIVHCVSDFVKQLVESQQYQTCKVCGHRDKFTFHVADEIWEKVVPSDYKSKVVCLACFDTFAKEKGISYKDALDLLCFTGDQECLQLIGY